MKLSRLIKSLYQQIFIGIVVQRSSIKVCVQSRKNEKVVLDKCEVFEISEATPSSEVNNFIKHYMEESPIHYLAVLNDVTSQGAVPTCSMHEAEHFNDMSSCVTLCNNDKWMAYSEKSELNTLQNRFDETGLDFIFSPFFILSRFFADKTGGKTVLLVLVQKDGLSLSIFSEGMLLFAKHFTTMDVLEEEMMSAQLDESVEESLDFDLEDDDVSINIDDLDSVDGLDDLDDLDSLQDLDDLDDLDDIDEIEDFEESLNDAVEESKITLEESHAKFDSKIGNFSDDYKRYQLIQASMHEFYNDDKYNNQFIEEVYIADACEVGQDLTRFLEEELFVSVYKRGIELEKEIVSMAAEEVFHAI